MFFLESKDTIQKSKGSELDARFGKIELEEKEEMQQGELVRGGKISSKDRMRAKLKERNKKVLFRSNFVIFKILALLTSSLSE